VRRREGNERKEIVNPEGQVNPVPWVRGVTNVIVFINRSGTAARGLVMKMRQKMDVVTKMRSGEQSRR